MSNIKINSKKKTLALIALFAISAIIFLNFQVKDVKAATGTDIPLSGLVYDPNNENSWFWHEDIQNGTEYIYETTIIMQNKTTQEYILGTKFYFIFNISIFNATIQWHDKPCFFSVINATERYYNNTKGKTAPYGKEGVQMNPEIIGGFQYNASEYPWESKERIATFERFPIPFFLPINGTHGQTINDNNNINKLADIINASIFYPYYARGNAEFGFPLMNLWNSITCPATGDPDTKAILFTNASGYKCKLEYNKNGTLQNGELYAEMLGGNASKGPETLIILNMTMNRIFDPNPVNEVEWGVKEGDIIYYGNNAGINYEECYLNITDIKNVTTNDEEGMIGFTLLYEGDPIINYQTVMATDYIWDKASGKYKENKNIDFGIATDYMPYLGVETEAGANFIIPNNTNKEDFLFCTNRYFIYMMMMEEANDYDFNLKDEKDFYKVDGSISSGNKRADVSYWYDKTTGVMSLLKFKDEIDPSWDCTFIKENYTLSTSNKNPLNTKMLDNVNATINITTTGVGYPFFVVGLLPESPVNESLPGYVTPLVYIDWFINDSSQIIQLNVTIKLPLDLDNYNVQFWVWNMSEETQYDWTEPYIPDIIKINYAENSISIILTHTNFPDAADVIIAFSYTARGTPLPPSGDDDDDGGGAEEPAAIPGFDLWVLFGVIGLVSLIAVLKKRKFVK